MISPEILKRSAAAGLLGAAVAGGVVWSVPHEADGESAGSGDWADPVRVSYDGSESEIRERPGAIRSGEQRFALQRARKKLQLARERSLEQRNRTARETREKLQAIVHRPDGQSEAETRLLDVQVDKLERR